MTVTIATPASNPTSRYRDPAFDCGGARIRAHCRHLATVVTIEGEIDAVNVDRVSEHTRRFILATDRLIVDLTDVKPISGEAVSFLYVLAEDCRAAGVEWMLVASEAITDLLRNSYDEAAFPLARSVHQALKEYADAIVRRRQLLLPLIRKTA